MIGRRPVDAALVFARRGWPVLPVHSPRPGATPCSCAHPDCTSPAKHPRITGGLKSATTDTAQIQQWWVQWRDANVGVRTGAESGLVVLDVDPRHSGHDTLARLEREHGPLPPGRTVTTGGDGLHLYFRHPGHRVANDAGTRLGPGLDIRGDGGYVLAPPSRHVSGGRYAVKARGGEVPPMPDWLLEALRAPRAERRSSPAAPDRRMFHRGDDTTAWARKALQGELDRLAQAPIGQRNNTLNRVAFRLGQIIAGGQLDEAEIEHLLVGRALDIGLGEREAVATVHSGISAGECEPRVPRSDQPAPHLHREVM